VIRFLVSPVALLDNGGAVGGIRLVRNRLVASETGTIQAKATDQFEELSAGLVFRSVGYRGVPLPGVPFDEKWGVVLNEKGRVLDPDTAAVRRGEYTAGWIKRGATGVIGTNKPDAAETVQAMTEELAAGHTLTPAEPDAATLERLIEQRQPQVVSYADWLRLNEIEVERGRARGRPRVKFTRVDDMLAALGNRGPR
jgi:ferredoxin--NADP+ reductase